MVQAPGPRGSPHVPQGPNDSLAAKSVLFPPTANTDNSRSSFVLWHEGHAGCCDPSTIVSNCCSHSLHRYSKMGISPPSLHHHSMQRVSAEDCSETLVAVQALEALRQRFSEDGLTRSHPARQPGHASEATEWHNHVNGDVRGTRRLHESLPAPFYNI